jgi:hypothetical protein
MKNKHYVVQRAVDFTGDYDGTFNVVCLAHDVSTQLKKSEAEALANSLNLQSCHEQDGFGE